MKQQDCVDSDMVLLEQEVEEQEPRRTHCQCDSLLAICGHRPAEPSRPPSCFPPTQTLEVALKIVLEWACH